MPDIRDLQRITKKGSLVELLSTKLLSQFITNSKWIYYCIPEPVLRKLAAWKYSDKPKSKSGLALFGFDYEAQVNITDRQWRRILTLLGIPRARGYENYNVFTLDEAIAVLLHTQLSVKQNKFATKEETQNYFSSVEMFNFGWNLEENNPYSLLIQVLQAHEIPVGVSGRTLPRLLFKLSPSKLSPKPVTTPQVLKRWSQHESFTQAQITPYCHNTIFNDDTVDIYMAVSLNPNQDLSQRVRKAVLSY